MNSQLASVLIILFVSLIVVLPAMRRSPGLGVLGGLVVMGLVLWQRGEGLAAIGLSAPDDWGRTLVLALFLGVLIALASQMLIDPLVEKATGQPHDISAVEPVRGSLKNLAITLLAVWVLAALVEEVLYRGFLMNEFMRLLGDNAAALAFALVASSLVFGLSHWYQGRSGVWSTGLVGGLLGLLFIASGFNLWLPILAHGVIDTVLLIFIYLNWDTRLKHLLVRQR